MYIIFVVLFSLFRQIDSQEVKYVGCFQRLAVTDDGNQNQVSQPAIDSCIDICYGRRVPYAALALGFICRCATGIDETRTSTCTRICDGRECGGTSAIPHAVYEIIAPVTLPSQSTSSTTTTSSSSVSTSLPSSSTSVTSSFPSSSTSAFSSTGSTDDRTSTSSTISRSTPRVTQPSLPNATRTTSTVLTSAPDDRTTDEPVVIPQTPTEDGMDIIPIVIGSVVGFVAVSLISIVIFCLCHRKRKANKHGEKIVNNEAELHQYSEMEEQNRDNETVFRGNGGINNDAYSEINNKKFSNRNNIYDQAAKDDGTYDKLHTQKQHNSKIKQQIVNDDTYDRCPSAKDDDTYNELNVKKPEIMDDTYDHTKNILQENDGTYDEFGGKRELVDDTYDHTKNIRQEIDGTYDEFGGKREEVDDTYDHTKNIRQEIDGTYDEFRGKSEEVDDTYDHTKNIRQEIDGTYDEFGDGKRKEVNVIYDHT